MESGSTDVADNAAPPSSSETTSQVRTWTAEELRIFLRSVEDERLYAAWLLAATTGMRRGEVLGLIWKNVDFETSRLAVRQTLVSVGYQVVASTPKTQKGRRSIALDETTLKVLRRHRARQLEEKLIGGGGYDDEDLVFANSLGHWLHPDGFSKAFSKLQSGLDLPRIRFHDLRHTHATLALRAGIHPRIVSERLGHSTIAMTLDTYSHVLPDMQEEAAAKVADLLFDTN